MLYDVCQPENNNSLSTFFNGGKFQSECKKHLLKNGKQITPSARHVYRVLLDKAGTQSYVWLSLSTIEEETGYTRPTVLKCLNELQDERFLAKYKMMKKNGLGNAYELDPEKIYNQAIDFDITQIEDEYNEETFLCDENATGKVVLPVGVKSLYPNNNLIIKEKKIGKDVDFKNHQNSFTDYEMPDSYLEEAKKCYEIATDNTTFDDYLEASFKVFLNHRRKQEYQHTEKLLDYWRLWVHRDMVLAQKVERAKRAEERAKEKAEKPKKSTPRTTKTKAVPVEQPKTELEAVTEWQENYFDQIIACEKIDELRPAMKEAVETGGVVCGSAGCGKTTTATELVKAFKEQNQKAEIYNWVKFYQDYLEKVKQDNLGKNKDGIKAPEVINFVIQHYKILILDEVGMKPMTQAEKALFYRIVDERQKLGLPTTIITNYDPRHLKSPDGVGFQSFDRLVQGKKIITCSWGSLRGRH
jgi:DNA replication protein DnaC